MFVTAAWSTRADTGTLHIASSAHHSQVLLPNDKNIPPPPKQTHACTQNVYKVNHKYVVLYVILLGCLAFVT